MGGAPAPQEGLFVKVHGDAVQSDGLDNGLRRYRQQSLLVGEANHEQVRGDGISHQRRGQSGGVDEMGILRGLGDGFHESLLGKLDVRVLGEGGGHGLVVVDHRMGQGGPDLAQGFGTAGGDQIAAQKHVGAAGGNAGGVDPFGLFGDAHMGDHGAVLLRQPRHIQNRNAVAFHVGGHAQKGADGDHPGAADAGNGDAIGFRHAGKAGFGQAGFARIREAGVRAGLLAQIPAVHGDEAGAEAVDAGKILVAR